MWASLARVRLLPYPPTKEEQNYFTNDLTSVVQYLTSDDFDVGVLSQLNNNNNNNNLLIYIALFNINMIKSALHQSI